jgi:preprotein translocase subunit SecA
MIGSAIRKIFGSKNDREIKRIQTYLQAINTLESAFEKLTDDELKTKTSEFKERIKKEFEALSSDLPKPERKEQEEQILKKIMPEAFATVREAAKRVLGMRHYDVQLIGGIVLHEGKIAEMKTGEGKTLMSTLPVYLNALSGRGAHVVTVNDYLAKRDSEWMGRVYKFLGLTVGTIQHDMSDEKRKVAYGSDITYGTNNEFGFDFLRDNMKFSIEQFVQRAHNFAVVDEVDSILIDEARTPLIISGPAEDSTDKYYTIDKIIPKLKKDEDFQVDEKARSANLTETGVSRVEELLNIENLYDPANVEILHHVNQGLKAHSLFSKDIDYIVKDDQVIIVDEFTGRLMAGRRWSDGLHQAVEAKEKVKIENENQTLATITFQNYFRLYIKLSGMTGTADTEAAEFQAIYGLEVIVVPSNRPMVRKDQADVIYRTSKEKFNAITNEIEELNKKGQPVLVGTISINNSELISTMLKKRGIKHQVLNAKFHEKEAEIVAQAGRIAEVTIATNMAGRGTDILLGGNPDFLAKRDFQANPDLDDEQKRTIISKYLAKCEEDKKRVIELGGLHILGTERHESRRIDNQLRGRAGRQGDPGSSRFYMSLEDDLLRIFGSDRISGIMLKLGMEEGEPIEHSMVSKAIENAQKKVEGHNFGIRKHLLEYDDVMSKQREVIYNLRRQILSGENAKDKIIEMAENVIEESLPKYIYAEKPSEEWDIKGLTDYLAIQFGIFAERKDNKILLPDSKIIDFENISADQMFKEITGVAIDAYDKKEAEMNNPDMMRYIERVMTLQIIDSQWKDHLLSMDHLKEGIGFRGYAQKNPLNEYKREGFDLFSAMIDRIKEESVRYLFRVQISKEQDEEIKIERKQQQRVLLHRGDSAGEEHSKTVKKDLEKVGRNDPCPCGSNKKYKKCCGKDM